MLPFVSTRGGDAATLDEALFRGLARDGGLYMPASIVPRPDAPPTGDWEGVTRWAEPALFSEMGPEELQAVVSDALSFPTPLVEVDAGVYVLELHHGPTHAFKDVGARFLARVASRRNRGGAMRTVLVATSGDTGGAVADAFHGIDGFRVVVLFPRDAVSERQRRQMTTLGENVFALAVRGSFDDCQRMTKEAFADEALAEDHRLMSANSINIGRLLPQTLYYVHAAAALGWTSVPARFVVPCGNLGNLCAGLLAQRMGMPSARFLAASNANRGFVDYLGVRPFEPRPSVRTISSAMDVGAPSNLERIRWLFDGDDDAVRQAVAGVAIDDDETRACMADVYHRTGYLLDPHGAVAYAAHRRVSVAAGTPSVVLATAHPAKFPEVSERVTGCPVSLPPGLARTADRPERFEEVGPKLADLAAALREIGGGFASRGGGHHASQNGVDHHRVGPGGWNE